MTEPDAHILHHLAAVIDGMSGAVDIALRSRDEARAAGIPHSKLARLWLRKLIEAWAELAAALRTAIDAKGETEADAAGDEFSRAVDKLQRAGRRLSSALADQQAALAAARGIAT